MFERVDGITHNVNCLKINLNSFKCKDSSFSKVYKVLFILYRFFDFFIALYLILIV